MSYKDVIRGRKAIRSTAIKEGVSYAEVEKHIQEALDDAWSRPCEFPLRQELFPNGKPSAAEFVGVMARAMKEKYG